MLDKIEWEKIHNEWAKAFRGKSSTEERFQRLKDLYFELTGIPESNENAIMHHRTSLYGEPCEQCGKPLRTLLAAFCAACGWRPES
jgi:hypothetical protein